MAKAAKVPTKGVKGHSRKLQPGDKVAVVERSAVDKEACKGRH